MEDDTYDDVMVTNGKLFSKFVCDKLLTAFENKDANFAIYQFLLVRNFLDSISDEFENFDVPNNSRNTYTHFQYKGDNWHIFIYFDPCDCPSKYYHNVESNLYQISACVRCGEYNIIGINLNDTRIQRMAEDRVNRFKEEIFTQISEEVGRKHFYTD